MTTCILEEVGACIRTGFARGWGCCSRPGLLVGVTAPASVAQSEEPSGGTFIGAWVGPCCNGNDWITPMDPGGDAHWFDKIYGRLTTFEVLDPVEAGGGVRRQCGRLRRADRRPGRVVGGLGRPADVDVPSPRGRHVARRRAIHRRRRQVHDRALLQPGQHHAARATTSRPWTASSASTSTRTGRPTDDHRHRDRRSEHDHVHLHRAQLAVPERRSRSCSSCPSTRSARSRRSR